MACDTEKCQGCPAFKDGKCTAGGLDGMREALSRVIVTAIAAHAAATAETHDSEPFKLLLGTLVYHSSKVMLFAKVLGLDDEAVNAILDAAAHKAQEDVNLAAQFADRILNPIRPDNSQVH